MSGFTKVLLQKDGVTVSIVEAEGKLKLVTDLGVGAGGGSLTGFAGVKGSIEVDLDGVLLVNAGLDLLAAKVPAAAGAVAIVKPFVDGELAKL